MAADLFMIIKDTVSPEGTRADNVAICQNIAILSIHDEPGGLAGGGKIGVKRACLAKMYRDHTFDDFFDSRLPLRRVSCGGHSVDDLHRVRLCLNIVYRAILGSRVTRRRHSVLLLQLFFGSFQCGNGACSSLGSSFAIGGHGRGERPNELRGDSGGSGMTLRKGWPGARAYSSLTCRHSKNSNKVSGDGNRGT